MTELEALNGQSAQAGTGTVAQSPNVRLEPDVIATPRNIFARWLRTNEP